MSNCYRVGLAILLVIGISATPVMGVRISYLFTSEGEQYANIHFDYRVPATFVAGDISHNVPNAGHYISNVPAFQIITTDKEAEVYEEWIEEISGFSQFTFLEIDHPFKLSVLADYTKWLRDWTSNITFYSSSDEVFSVQGWNIRTDTYNLTSDSGGHIAVYCDCFYQIVIVEIVSTAGLSWTILLLPLIILLWRRKYG